MKKFLYTLTIISLTSSFLHAQDPAPVATPANDDLDKKVRFGLRVTPQPTWLTSVDKNNTPSGAKFGFGFGLNLDFRLSSVASFVTGIGGDFEGGKYTVKHDPANRYEVAVWKDESDAVIKPDQKVKTAGTVSILKERSIKSSFITIPLILKLSTKEYNGLKYYGMFGGELGFRLKGRAEDTYSEIRQYKNDTLYTTISSAETTESSIDITKELFPVRFAFNAGIGTEYRLAGSTSLFVSLNFFRSLTPYTFKESKYLTYRTDNITGKDNYRFVKQNLVLSAFKINIGIMF